MDSINRLRQAADELAQRAMPCSNAPDYADVRWKVHQLADAIECEVRERYVPLPLDADGIPIYVGDVVERTDPPRHPSEVMSMVLFGDGDWQVHIDERQNVHASYQPKLLRHHALTVEDVLREFALACEDAGNAGPEVERIVAEYAARLRLAGDE